MENSNKQTPATLNQIESTKPNVPRSFNLLEGDISGSFDAGHYHTIAYREVMAGERIAVQGVRLCIQTATPLTPAYQKLTANVQVFHVPHERVFKNYPKFAAQNGGSTENKIEELPNFKNREFPVVTKYNATSTAVSLQETTLWRDSFLSWYITRVGAGYQINTQEVEAPFIKCPPQNALLPRGFVAIWNDFLRNKEYDEEKTEFNEDYVSEYEWSQYLYTSPTEQNRDYYTARARRNNSYYMNYRTEAQGQDLLPKSVEDTGVDEFALNYANYEASFNEIRSQAENAQMNDYDVMQQIRGARKLTQGRVNLIGKKSFTLNYSAITQNAYNNNTEIEDRFRVMGMQGGYSYTEIDLGFINNLEIEEDGYIHVIMSVTADTVFESGIDRTLINNRWDERYRPDLKDKKLDVIKTCEYGVLEIAKNAQSEGIYDKAEGFKRAFNEYFRLPTCVNGETFNRGYFLVDETGQYDGERIQPYNTYQFYETCAYLSNRRNETGVDNKKIWLDYSDFMLNKNLAIPFGWQQVNENEYIKQGQTQIYYVGKHYAVTDMPIDEAIKDNYTKWGEH